MSPKRKPNMSFLSGVTHAGKSDYQIWMLAAAGISLLLIAVYTLFNLAGSLFEDRFDDVDLPDFAAITSSSERKQAFFDFLEPYVAQANEQILEERAAALKLQSYYDRNGKLSRGRLADFNALRESYKFDPVETPTARDFEDLLNRVDIIPASLALAQAAIESGWGTSRFARQGNNLFGIWCYEPGCGLVPQRRPAGKTYEVAAYPSPRASFLDYLRNLNTGSAYVGLRDIRSTHRENGVEPTGSDLASGLSRYSQERWTYVEKVRGLIASNGLDQR